MAEVEAKVSENVMEACARTESVRKCVLTSSLLACIWRNGTQSELPPVIDHSCWSDESLCVDKKLWYALGKLKAEKTAWKIAEAKGLKLSTICPALITTPNLLYHHPTPTIAYLKGAHEMYANGLLATVDVDNLAKAHVRVYEAMQKAVYGRYVCFDKVISTEYEAEELSEQTGFSLEKIRGDNKYGGSTAPFRLSDRKLSSLLSRSSICCLDDI
ncbi:PREDICTED: cinnamoyl-CoA reductase-like SNL6 [Tarenaya hassleriana]|uniref:cinnamoyl-CoA reductase-like SNL6 n=1 Tax=Tarenaya hassleriana TaxID=28532 RepID=UPI00053C4FE2|nr:PREDICTED: cinnamoyl-CoA reductase-like SNL6 [Tarenaya hassleriana]